MNKIVLGLVILAVLGGGIWYLTRSKPGAMPGANSTQPTVEEFSGTLAQAMNLGVAMKCEWNSPDGTGESYVKGDNLYVKTQVEGKTGLLVKKGDCVYTWSETEKQGVKFCQEASQPDQATQPGPWAPDNGSYPVMGADLNVQYNCRPDVFSGDRFTLPDDVQFLDMEAAFKNMMPSQALPDLPVQTMPELPAEE
jgi:hypothetical protein